MNAIAPSLFVPKMPFAPEEAVFALGGDTPGHIWVRTCPTLYCDCRDALVLAGFEGQEALLDRATPVRAASLAGSGVDDAAAEVKGLVAFRMDIDALFAYAPAGSEPLDLAEHPDISAVSARMKGDMMEAIGRLWLKGKGMPDPETRVRAQGNAITVPSWQPGQLLGWVEADLKVREDVYHYKNRYYGAYDRYCTTVDCDCGEVLIEFCAGNYSTPPVGHVVVKFAGEVRFEAERNSKHLIEVLWSMFTARHPNYLAQFQEREKKIKTLHISGVSYQARSTKVGRNDPCTCGSGKKYKKCCGATGG